MNKPRPRFVVRPCDNLGSVEGLVRDRTWQVYDTKSDTYESEHVTRSAARAEATRLNADPLYCVRA